MNVFILFISFIYLVGGFVLTGLALKDKKISNALNKLGFIEKVLAIFCFALTGPIIFIHSLINKLRSTR